ncbi:uncharacterized protein BP5553_01902 [Venustampulla echinocandica]|uniref:Uncharacterized protein n=1 Tax=Venustampulla echinocandica TaxID=2656787 RepID=A0A370U2F6_9HELO|nr:uncharacterized protein BP5553_01902 [Venustampulla echinocandica]RDL41923.1 hypothetical protein BP5553_01902 [Venustampulla echinocandica]
MPPPGNLLRSHAGLELPSEVCLAVFEHAVEDDPRSAATLMQISKTFHSLLKTYEKSITKLLSSNDSWLEYVNAKQHMLLSSCIFPGDATVTMFTYGWYREVRFRSAITDLLIEHDITAMDDTTTNDWPSLDVPRSELRARAVEFKKRSFSLMYRLVDTTAGMVTKQEVRAQQAQFLASLSATELAMLGCMVEVIGQGFFAYTRKLVLSSFCKTIVNERYQVVPLSSMDLHNVPTPVPPFDWDELLNGQNWITEYACVFEDRVQRFGPYFAWAYVTSSQARKLRPDHWVNSELQQGIHDLNAYEGGYTMAYASLQSVVWRTFCGKIQCSLEDSWDAAKKMVELEMVQFRIEACDTKMGMD